MHNPLIPRRTVVAVVVAAIFLPITLAVVLGVASLLTQMGDTGGGAVLQRIARRAEFWVIDLICLVLASAISSMRGPDDE